MTYYVYTLALDNGKYYIAHSVTALEDAVTFFETVTMNGYNDMQ